MPVSYIEEGDPYLDQTRQTVEMVMKRIGEDRPHSLSFQSKVGPVKWLRPSTDETIRQLAAEGVSQVLLVPVSFVSEHIETLYELDILYRQVAEEVGLRTLPPGSRAQLPAGFYRRAGQPCGKSSESSEQDESREQGRKQPYGLPSASALCIIR